jgi:glycosyltransferase involved in cell wall biosynthesis
MKISILSNAPWVRSGYGVQCGLFAPRFQKAGHEVAITAFFGLEGAVLAWNGIPVYPRAFDGYGNDIMAANAAHFKADFLLTNVDAWVIDPNRMIHGTRWVAWIPIDHDPCPKIVADKINTCFTRIAPSKFGQAAIEALGMDCLYAPYAVDTNIYKPKDQKEARMKLGLKDDRFIFGIVAMNKGQPSRKAFEPQMRAFAKIHQVHKDTALYLHTQDQEQLAGINLRHLANYLGIGDCVQFCDQHANILGFPDDYMVNAYNAIDCLMLCSMGEGFGIPLVEAQACGTPVITGDWTAMGELCFSGWKIPKKQADAWWTAQLAYQFMPRVGPIVNLMETAYAHARDTDIKEKARAGALEYDADVVMEKYWTPTLTEIQRRIDAVNATKSAFISTDTATVSVPAGG